MTNEINSVLANGKAWKNFQGSGERAHFYHANGFPLGVYAPLLSRLRERFDLNALEMRPTWREAGELPRRRDWQIYADDLITHIEQNACAPIIGIGHSMGATCTVLAAHKRPDLFKALILIEPAMVSPTLAVLTRLLPKSVMNLTEPAKGTLRKKDRWESRAQFIEACKASRMYKRFGEEAFTALSQFGVRESSDGAVELGFPKSWESHNYTQPPYVLPLLKQLQIPCAAIRGKPSVFFTQALWSNWQKLCPQTVFLENLDHGHLLPLENPAAAVGLINEAWMKLSAMRQVDLSMPVTA